jgi:hypothetical protein
MTPGRDAWDIYESVPSPAGRIQVLHLQLTPTRPGGNPSTYSLSSFQERLKSLPVLKSSRPRNLEQDCRAWACSIGP